MYISYIYIYIYTYRIDIIGDQRRAGDTWHCQDMTDNAQSLTIIVIQSLRFNLEDKRRTSALLNRMDVLP